MNWITREILNGLQRLSCLGLDREPASDLIEGTVAGWVDAVATDAVWDEELDAPRFRKAFSTLGKTRTTWPAPRDFLDALPPREQLALTKQHIPADPARAEAAINEIAKLLMMPK